MAGGGASAALTSATIAKRRPLLTAEELPRDFDSQHSVCVALGAMFHRRPRGNFPMWRRRQEVAGQPTDEHATKGERGARAEIRLVVACVRSPLEMQYFGLRPCRQASG